MTQITDHLANIERRVAAAVARSQQQTGGVKTLAVSKGQPIDAITAAHDAGQRRFAENYLQEAIQKMDSLADLDIEWHFIGRIQSNKTRLIAEKFDWVHTVDRPRIAERLSADRSLHTKELNVLIQLNIENEVQKGGVEAQAVPELADLIESLPRLRLRGLMSIPPAKLDTDALRQHFTNVSALANRLGEQGRDMDCISMGMSGDFELAIECGATMVRLGTAIFGPRNSPPV